MINFQIGRKVVAARRKARADFEALPLTEQIRQIVRQEIRSALAEQERFNPMTHMERYRQQFPEPERSLMGMEKDTFAGLPIKVVPGLPADQILIAHPDTKFDLRTGQAVNAEKSFVIKLTPHA